MRIDGFEIRFPRRNFGKAEECKQHLNNLSGQVFAHLEAQGEVSIEALSFFFTTEGCSTDEARLVASGVYYLKTQPPSARKTETE